MSASDPFSARDTLTTALGEHTIYRLDRVLDEAHAASLPYSIRDWVSGSMVGLGTDGFGLSEGRAALRDRFEVDEAVPVGERPGKPFLAHLEASRTGAAGVMGWWGGGGLRPTTRWRISSTT